MSNSGRLYGLDNGSRANADLWGKNQFNSNFPASLACFMRDNDKSVIYFKVLNDLKTECVEYPIDELFNTKLKNDELYFDFESKFEPYSNLVEGAFERVDLVVRTAKFTEKNGNKIVAPGEALRALEVKLTVTPDNSTHKKEQSLWGPEIVIRPATIKYCALGIASNVGQNNIKEIFNDIGKDVKNWGNSIEAKSILKDAIQGINELHKNYSERQQPLIMQPIWKTQGRAPILDQSNAFDIFIWSDFALSRVFTDIATENEGLSRYGRSVLRLTKYLYEYGRGGCGNIDNYFSTMTYDHQSDKEFSLPGRVTNSYLKHPRLENPSMPASVVKNLILDDGQKNLSPERRFDQTIYFTYEFE